MTIAILATGDELVHGDTLNTNARDLAQILSSEGLPLGLHLVCSDKETDIVECLQFLSKKHDIIILLGGLGPTTDDLTRFALAKWTGLPLVQHPQALVHVQNRLLAAKIPMNEGNLQQCLFPANAQLLPNPNGSAVGCYFQWNNKTFIMLPGPPRECLPMFNEYALPLLTQVMRSQKHILKWRLFGVAESEIGEILENALADIACQTGYRLDVPYIEFKVRCTSGLVDTVKQIVDPIIAPHCITFSEKKASEELHDLILKHQEPITIIDEATDGLLQTLISKPDTHHLISCNTLGKTRLNFQLSGLDDYWFQKPVTGLTQLTVHYSNQSQEGKETREVPYRSPLVVQYAAEWLSFRLVHLINQLY